MTFRTINIGSAPNAGDGDKLRISFSDINTNFTLTQAGLDNISTVIGGKVGADSPALVGTPTAPLLHLAQPLRRLRPPLL
jgi:hypothetical protein